MYLQIYYTPIILLSAREMVFYTAELSIGYAVRYDREWMAATAEDAADLFPGHPGTD